MNEPDVTVDIIPVFCYRVVARCSCGGRLHATGESTRTNPPSYWHLCENKCGAEHWLDRAYPYVDHRDKSE